MTTQMRRKIKKLEASIRRNSPRIEKKLAMAGVKPDSTLVVSMAKYLQALNKLAKE